MIFIIEIQCSSVVSSDRLFLLLADGLEVNEGGLLGIAGKVVTLAAFQFDDPSGAKVKPPGAIAAE